MRALLDRRLIVVTGKGGVGKTTIAAALGLLAAQSGRRTLVVELGEQGRLAAMFGVGAGEEGEPVRLRERLSALTIDQDKALMEWLQALGGRVPGRILGSSGTFQYFAAAAPGARELVTMVKLWRLTESNRRGRAAHDLVVLDAHATGHALAMVRSPQTFGAIARVGPVARDSARVRELLGDADRSAYVGVALGTEMAVTEALELDEGFAEATGLGLSEVVVNALLPRRFQTHELQRLDELATAARRGTKKAELLLAAARAAREVHVRASFQHGQVTRLRRRGFEVAAMPFLWEREIELDALSALAARLERHLDAARR